MKLINVELLLSQLDGSGSDIEWNAIEQLRALPNLPDMLLKHYSQSKSFSARAACVYHSVRYAKTSKSALELGLRAVLDRSKIVRYRAAMLLVVAQSPVAIPALEAMKEKWKASASDAEAAIAALNSGNPNRFVDRENTGLVTLRIR